MNTADSHDMLRKRLDTLASRIDTMKNGDLAIVVEPGRLVGVMVELMRDPALKFTTLMNQLGVDYGDRMAVLHNLHSPLLNRKITVKTFVESEHPEVPSISHLFPGCGWFERETYDLFGIVFTGHLNLRRLLLPDDWEGHPLRKNYQYPSSYNGFETGRSDLLDETQPPGADRV